MGLAQLFEDSALEDAFAQVLSFGEADYVEVYSLRKLKVVF